MIDLSREGADSSMFETRRMMLLTELPPRQHGSTGLGRVKWMDIDMKILDHGFKLSNRLDAFAGFNNHAQF